MPWWSDEDTAIASCSSYIAGNIMFMMASAFYFPKMWLFTPQELCADGHEDYVVEDGYLLERPAVVLFILGSVTFVVGGLIDFLAVLRQHHRREGPTEATALFLQNEIKVP